MFKIHDFYVLWNRFLFRKKGIIYGKKMMIYNKLYINKSSTSKIVIGDNFTLVSGNGYNAIASNTRGVFKVEKDAQLKIGNDCGMSAPSFLIKRSLTIGNHVLLGGSVLIMDSDRHSLDWNYRGSRGGYDEQGRLVDALHAKTAPIVIEDDVLIGARSIILKGVTIGARSVIGAGSVVSQSIPPDCIAAGNPCKIIKYINKK